MVCAFKHTSTTRKMHQKANSIAILINAKNKIKKLLTWNEVIWFFKEILWQQSNFMKTLWFFMTGWNFMLFYDFMPRKTHVPACCASCAISCISRGGLDKLYLELIWKRSENGSKLGLNEMWQLNKELKNSWKLKTKCTLQKCVTKSFHRVTLR